MHRLIGEQEFYRAKKRDPWKDENVKSILLFQPPVEYDSFLPFQRNSRFHLISIVRCTAVFVNHPWQSESCFFQENRENVGARIFSSFQKSNMETSREKTWDTLGAIFSDTFAN